MRISLNWLKKYVTIPEEVSDEELIKLIGARLVEVEGVIDETHKYDNIYVVRVETCKKIPETHLSLCEINNGTEDLVQVVCGAPNVREGMLAVWIAPGAIVPASVHEDAPFVIGKRKMRGYESNGMLAGADELDFGDDHSGIVEIDPSMAQPGDQLADLFDLKDLILEIENKSLTHRPDCFGLIGFAREIAGILGQKFEDSSVLNSESTQLEESIHLKLAKKQTASVKAPEIVIDDDGICPRYSAIVLEKHGEIKKKYLSFLDTILSKSGMRPIEPIVDATNYLMLLTGQPLHAFDYDKFVAIGGTNTPRILVRLARDGEKLTLLDEKEVELNTSDIVICSNDTPVALAGAMGGKSTEVDDTTRSIILESATFSLYNLRKTQMVHGIFSEAITRFTKGQPAYQTMKVAKACAEMLANGFRIATMADEYPGSTKVATGHKTSMVHRSEESSMIVVKITTDEINGILGTDYERDLVIQTLENVGFRIKHRRDALEIVVPEWRTDIHIKEDITEEVGRLLGYDNIRPTLPLHGTADKSEMLEFKKQVRELLSCYGANEVLTYSFVSGNLLKRAKQKPENSYKIVNSISPELQYVRQSLVPSLLSKAYMNEKLPVEKFGIFEMNKVYRREWGLNNEQVPIERMSLGFVVAERKNTETSYYKAKLYLVKLLKEFNITAEFRPMQSKEAETLPFEPRRSADVLVNGELVGVVGEFRQSVKHDFKLADYLAGFEINLELIMKFADTKKQIDYREKKREDLTITTDRSYAETLAMVAEKHPGATITPGLIYQAEGQTTKNMTFHLEY